MTHSFQGAESQQLNIWSQKPIFHRLIPEQICAQVLLVVISEDRNNSGIGPELIRDFQSTDEVGPG